VDGTSNSKFEIKKIRVGDIVRIMRYDANNYNVPAYGIVIKSIETKQIYMFPTVEILLFGTRQRRVAMGRGNIEVISHA